MGERRRVWGTTPPSLPCGFDSIRLSARSVSGARLGNRDAIRWAYGVDGRDGGGNSRQTACWHLAARRRREGRLLRSGIVIRIANSGVLVDAGLEVCCPCRHHGIRGSGGCARRRDACHGSTLSSGSLLQEVWVQDLRAAGDPGRTLSKVGLNKKLTIHIVFVRATKHPGRKNYGFRQLDFGLQG